MMIFPKNGADNHQNWGHSSKNLGVNTRVTNDFAALEWLKLVIGLGPTRSLDLDYGSCGNNHRRSHDFQFYWNNKLSD